jgi:hypothetical protein
LPEILIEDLHGFFHLPFDMNFQFLSLPAESQRFVISLIGVASLNSATSKTNTALNSGKITVA